ncbi:hypothetical protein A3E49_03535 [Candidatus Saccharibacteria bacterium RIFCSPHIGHO2_12_FULL_49_19]|nr:MAG: hypothetical protein A2708_02675 [Candidatus Saccharibacteria bacterium RIFCSPHIGHO2_01_FULL_49_21]OGL36215.1 MAG: hypothetical protein A3E49_03535 [Candidatus Saccharibacteria bacterium RIFCSPHIGHO2_12_FULL_49_19]OGL37315.1 MAG: hypothetical protein A3B63_02060 [Candidatus Saccharibacteria bacterium RIFCSPLOWO2_01_FULL_49_22]
MEVEVNWLGVGSATLTSMLVGWAWYSKPVFGDIWTKIVKLDDKKSREAAPKALIAALLMSAVTAYVLAHVTYLSFIFFDVSYLNAALTTAFWLWLGLVATRFIVHDAFEMRPPKLTYLNIGNELVTLLAMGLAIGWIGL